MAIQYASISESDFSAGLDTTTAESNIQPGFVEDLKNLVPDSGGSIKTRTGFIGFSGNIPLRVKSAEAITSTKIRFVLDSSITVASLARQPVIAFGYSSAYTGGWEYFPSVSTDIPILIPPYDISPSSSVVSLEQYKTGLTSKYVALGVSSTDFGSSISNFLTFGTDDLVINPSTLDTTVTIINNTGSNKYFYVYYINPVSTGETYVVDTFTSSSTWSMDASALPNNNMIIRCYDSSGTMLIPDSLTFNDTTSVITATFGSNVAGFMMAVSAESSAFLDFPVPQGMRTTYNLPKEIEGEVIFVECYKQNIATNEYTLIAPEEISYDTSQTYPLTVTFDNYTDADFTVRVLWREGEQAARSAITVEYATAHGVPLGTDNNPQIVIYGPDHCDLYSDGAGDRPGWTSFVDRYRTATEDRMVCGLGWNSFQELKTGETLAGIILPQSSYNIFPGLRSRVVALSTFFTGPAISNGTPRTNANLDVPAASTTGTLMATSLTQVGTAVTIRTTLSGATLTGNASDLGTYVTILQAPVTELIGDHEIQSITVAGDTSYVEFTIIIAKGSVIDFTRFSGVPIEWGIFTDELEVETASSLLPGDKVNLSGYEDSYPDVYCLSAYKESSKYYVSLSNIKARNQLPNRMLLLGERTTNVIPLRTEFEDESLDTDLWLVPGDMIKLNGYDIEERIKVVTTHLDITLTTPSAVVSGGYVTWTIDGGATLDTNVYKVGDSIILKNAGTLSGEYEIATLISATEFVTTPKATTKADGTYTPADVILCGSAVEIYGEPVAIEDDVENAFEITVQRRWLPIDKSDIIGTYGTRAEQFYTEDFADQPFVRSVVAGDSMYMVNGSDPVYKYDGEVYHLAGIPRINPCVLVSKNTAASGKISFPSTVATAASGVTQALSKKVYYAEVGSAAGFSVGDYVQVGSTDTGCAITAITRSEITNDASNRQLIDLIELDSALDSTSGNLVPAKITYTYYFKYYLVDRHNNRVQSATLGHQDIKVDLTASTRVQFRVVGLPMVDAADYSRMEIEVYRTAKNKSAPFYRIRNVEVPYPILDYVDIYDSTDDALLTDLDYTTSALESQELTTGISLPPVSRCLTVASNRLLLGACTSVPSYALTLTNGTTSDVTSADMTGITLSLKLAEGTYIFKSVDPTPKAITDIVESGASASGTPLVTITSSGHGLVADDWVYLTRTDAASGVNPRLAGWYKIESATASGFDIKTTLAIADGLATTPFASGADVNKVIFTTTAGAIPVYTGTTDDDFINTTLGNNDDYPVFTMLPRFGMAINSVMAKDYANITESGFVWAEYGNDVSPAGTLIIKGVRDTFQVKYEHASTDNMRVYVNGTQNSTTDTGWVDSLTQFRGSRIVKSYPKYYELFDNPDAEDASTSGAVIDVNPSDGEVITAMMPLIGPSTSSSSQLQSTVIVFKEKSIYAVNVDTGSFDKLETNGVGTPYPNSAAPTQGGIAFASVSGIYMIDRSLRVRKLSSPADDILFSSDRSDESRLQGHSFITESQYKLSLSNGSVMVYNYEREMEGKPGAWCEYTGYSVAGGWCNKGEYEFFAGTCGRVFINRTSGTVKDYRDDSNTPIAVDVKFRANHFGDPSIRKQLRHVSMGFRNSSVETDDTAVKVAFDCSTDFTTVDEFKVETTSNSSISQIRFGIPTGRFNYVQLRVQNSTIDQPIEITGITYKVAGLKVAGTEEAKTTKG